MNLTRKWQAATLALMLSSGAAVAPAAAQSAGDDVEMDRIVIALPNGKRIVRFVPRAAEQPPAGSENTNNPPPNKGGSGNNNGNGNGSGGGDNALFTPPDIPDDLARQVAQWLMLYRAGNMAADANRDGILTPADYSAHIAFLRAHSDVGGSGSSGGSNNADPDPDPDNDNDSDNNDNDNPGPNTTQGWTELAPSSESRVIYVSSSNGDDSNNGLSESAPVRSLSRGLALLRSGQPDWLLFKRGDTFSGTFGRFNFSGMSADKPLVIGAYGSGPRPKFITGSAAGFDIVGSTPRKHVAIVGLHMEPGSGHPAGGVRIVSNAVDGLLIEDCYLTRYNVNILVQGEDNAHIKNVRIRRNILTDAMGSTHSQGIYASRVTGMTIEGNILDRNGWDHNIGRRDATIFAHNVYMQRSVADLVFKDNIVMRASSHGLQARRGGIVEGNIFYQNPMAIMFGNEGAQSDEVPVRGTVKHNIILEGVDINPDLSRGNGIVIQNTAQAEVTHNILSRNINGPNGAYGISIDGPNSAPVRNTLIASNIIHDWDLAFRIHDYNAVSATFKNNILSNSDADRPLIRHRRSDSVSGITYLGNHYKRAGNEDWFQVSSNNLSLPEWATQHGQDARRLTGSFADASRTMDSYARSIGLSGAPAMLEAMRAMRKGNWDARLTPEAIGAYFREGFTVSGVTN